MRPSPSETFVSGAMCGMTQVTGTPSCLAMGDKVMYATPLHMFHQTKIFPSWLSIESIQGGVRMTPPPGAGAARRGRPAPARGSRRWR
jgi:hypothetical protein